MIVMYLFKSIKKKLGFDRKYWIFDVEYIRLLLDTKTYDSV